MECSSCGEPVEPGQLSCPACGALTVLDDPVYRASTDDPPTELMPAVERPDNQLAAEEAADDDSAAEPARPTATAGVAASQPSDPPGEPGRAPLAPPGAGPVITQHPPAVAPAADVQDAGRESAPSRGRTEMVLAGSAVAIALVALLVAGVGMGNDFAVFAPGAGSPGAAADESPLSVEDTGEPTDLPPEEGFACSPQTFSAPETGKWRLYRTEFGRRGQSDYLRLKLRRDGGHEQAATVSAEVVRPEELSARYEFEPPADADSVLVIAFNGPVNTGSSWNARPGYGALRAFEVKRGRESNVHVVVAAAGDACFRLSASDWQVGRMSDPTDIAVQIQRR